MDPVNHQRRYSTREVYIMHIANEKVNGGFEYAKCIREKTGKDVR